MKGFWLKTVHGQTTSLSAVIKDDQEYDADCGLVCAAKGDK
jgi:hypothetical protein